MPRVFLKQILWHSKDGKRPDRVYSIDWQRNSRRLASCGADEFIHVSEIDINNNELNIKCMARLLGHEGEINIVRWSPNGVYLASGGSDKTVILWKKSEKLENVPIGYDTSELSKFPEFYNRYSLCRCTDIVNTLAWSPNGRQIAVALEDFKIFVMALGNDDQLTRVSCLDGHTNMVQGIAWDPLNEYIASQSCDQSVRLWAKKSDMKGWKLETVIRNFKDKDEGKLSNSIDFEDGNNPQGQWQSNKAFFQPESSYPSFFRRLDWSPEGSLLITPAGQQYTQIYSKKEEEVRTPHSCLSSPSQTNMTDVYFRVSYAFHRKLLPISTNPFATHRSMSGTPVCVRFSPVVFEATELPPDQQKLLIPKSMLPNQSWAFPFKSESANQTLNDKISNSNPYNSSDPLYSPKNFVTNSTEKIESQEPPISIELYQSIDTSYPNSFKDSNTIETQHTEIYNENTSNNSLPNLLESPNNPIIDTMNSIQVNKRSLISDYPANKLLKVSHIPTLNSPSNDIPEIIPSNLSTTSQQFNTHIIDSYPNNQIENNEKIQIDTSQR